jgi:hypothetical protein
MAIRLYKYRDHKIKILTSLSVMEARLKDLIENNAGGE